jgi:FAD/FMN-containing dehydrogenase
LDLPHIHRCVVTALPQKHTTPSKSFSFSCDSNEHRDLIVGCRGGGGNFGVVTKFTFRGHKLPKYCHGGNKVFMTPTLASAVQVCKNLEALTSEIPDNAAWLLVCPAGAPVVPTMWTHFGDEENAKVPR